MWIFFYIITYEFRNVTPRFWNLKTAYILDLNNIISPLNLELEEMEDNIFIEIGLLIYIFYYSLKPRHAEICIDRP